MYEWSATNVKPAAEKIAQVIIYLFKWFHIIYTLRFANSPIYNLTIISYTSNYSWVSFFPANQFKLAVVFSRKMARHFEIESKIQPRIERRGCAAPAQGMITRIKPSEWKHSVIALHPPPSTFPGLDGGTLTDVNRSENTGRSGYRTWKETSGFRSRSAKVHEKFEISRELLDSPRFAQLSPERKIDKWKSMGPDRSSRYRRIRFWKGLARNRRRLQFTPNAHNFIVKYTAAR